MAEDDQRIVYAVDDVTDIARRLAELEGASPSVASNGTRWAIWYPDRAIWIRLKDGRLVMTEDHASVTKFDDEQSAQAVIDARLGRAGSTVSLIARVWPYDREL